MDARRTAMVGGSFDPVHLGHLHLIHMVVTHTRYRRFILVPVAMNNFKRDHVPAAGADRFRMLQLSCEAYAGLYPHDEGCELLVDDCELVRGGVSFTSDTAMDLSQRYPIDGRLGIVMGDDLLGDLKKWHAFDTLKNLVTFVVIRREPEKPVFDDPSVDITFVDGAVFPDSSTEIRERIAALGPGEPISPDVRSLMVKEVADYVDGHGLYRTHL